MKFFILCILLICFLLVVTEAGKKKNKDAEGNSEEIEDGAKSSKKDKNKSKDKSKDKGKNKDNNKDKNKDKDEKKKCKGKKKKKCEDEADKEEEGKSLLSKKQQKACEKIEKTLLSCIEDRIYILDLDAYKFKEEINLEFETSEIYTSIVEEEIDAIKDDVIDEYFNSDAFQQHVIEIIEEYNKTDEAQALINQTVEHILEDHKHLLESEYNQTEAELDRVMEETLDLLDNFILLLLNRSLENKGVDTYLNKFDFLTSSDYEAESELPPPVTVSGVEDIPEEPTTNLYHRIWNNGAVTAPPGVTDRLTYIDGGPTFTNDPALQYWRGNEFLARNGNERSGETETEPNKYWQMIQTAKQRQYGGAGSVYRRITQPQNQYTQYRWASGATWVNGWFDRQMPQTTMPKIHYAWGGAPGWRDESTKSERTFGSTVYTTPTEAVPFYHDDKDYENWAIASGGGIDGVFAAPGVNPAELPVEEDEGPPIVPKKAARPPFNSNKSLGTLPLLDETEDYGGVSELIALVEEKEESAESSSQDKDTNGEARKMPPILGSLLASALNSEEDGEPKNTAVVEEEEGETLAIPGIIGAALFNARG